MIDTSPRCRGFLDAIIAEPQDDGIRLIFADFLEEQREPEFQLRGAFIRAQIELYHIERDGSTPAFWRAVDNAFARHNPQGQVCRCRRCTLQRWTQETLDDQWFQWFGSYQNGHYSLGLTSNAVGIQTRHGPVWFAVERGFVNKVSASLEAWMELHVWCTQIMPVQEVMLTTFVATWLFSSPNLWCLGREWAEDAVYVAPGEYRPQAILKAKWPRIVFTMPDSHVSGMDYPTQEMEAAIQDYDWRHPAVPHP